MKTYRCPVCRKTLTKNEYEQALGILGERERHLHEEAQALQSRHQRERQTLLKSLQTAKVAAQKARQEGVESERSRTRRLLEGKAEEIRRLRERIEQLKRGATPQTQGLEFEITLVSRLHREFPEDDVQHKGKHGDVLHLVTFEGKCVGRIIYECKRTPNIPEDHIQQCFHAKQDRDAAYAVLVTTGHRRGFNGFEQRDGVIVVAPAALLHVVSLLRTTLIEMARARITKEKRAVIAQRLLEYVASPQFKNPIEEVVQVASDLERMVVEEAKDHQRIWQRRWERYQRIRWDSSQIQRNLQLVLHGKEPAAILQPKVIPLQLPASSN